MLLAAGRSSRLGAIGQILPKPLLPICGYPAISFGIAACARVGLREIVINLFHHGDQIREALGDGSAWGVRLQYSPEDDLLGTAGGIAQADSLLGAGAVLVMNAKVVADVDLMRLIHRHQQTDADATLLLRDDPRAAEWGPIGTADDGSVVSILGVEAPAAASNALARPPVRMFTGVQVISSQMRARMRSVFSDSVRDAYIPALREGRLIQSDRLAGYFAEHSTPERYLAGNWALLRNPDLLPFPPGPLVGVDPAARVHEGASIVGPVRVAPGATIENGAIVGPDVVVGGGGVVAQGARLTRVVVWPGGHARGDLQDAIVTREGTVTVTPGQTTF